MVDVYDCLQVLNGTTFFPIELRKLMKGATSEAERKKFPALTELFKKYMRFMIDQHFKDEPMDNLNKGLFAFAAYDLNLWFGNVEQIASERIAARRSHTSAIFTSTTSPTNCSPRSRREGGRQSRHQEWRELVACVRSARHRRRWLIGV